MRIAIFQNFLDTIGGAEVVGLTMARELDADIYTTNIDRGKISAMGFDDVLPRIFSIGKVPKNAPFRQQMVLWRFHTLNLKGKYDFFVINGDWAVSGAVNNKPNLWYVNATIREIWDLREYVREKLIRPWKRPIFDLWSNYNRYLNKKHVGHVGAIASNSTFTKERVKKYLNRDSNLVYPPTQTNKFRYDKTGDYWLSVNRLIGYKRVDMQLKAFAKMPDEKLIVIGPYEKSKTSLSYVDLIKRIKPTNVTIIEGADSFEELAHYYANCKGFITTCLAEDFGMTVVEAMASGKPVIAPNEGGYRETVIDGETGILIDDLDEHKLAIAIQQLSKELKDSVKQNNYQKECRRQAEKFDASVFTRKIQSLIEQTDNSSVFRLQLEEPVQSQAPFFSICTACMGRLEQLKQTLPMSLSHDDVEVILVDYSCPEHSGDWAEQTFPEEIRSGKLKVIRVPDRKEYWRSHAKNISHAYTRGSILINADADNFINNAYLQACKKLFEEDSDIQITIAAPWDIQTASYGMYGRIAIRRDAFRDLCGYDEDMCGWGYEDNDLIDRAKAMNFKIDYIPHKLLKLLEHGDDLRTRYERNKNKWRANRRHKKLSARNVSSGRLRANQGRIKGSF